MSVAQARSEARQRSVTNRNGQNYRLPGQIRGIGPIYEFSITGADIVDVYYIGALNVPIPSAFYHFTRRPTCPLTE